MSFFKKITQGLGLNTAQLELEIPDSVPIETGEISGVVTISAKSNQRILSIKIQLVEAIIVGSGEDEEEEINEIAIIELGKPFEIQQNESRSIEFTLPFNLPIDDPVNGNKVEQFVKWISSPTSLGFEVLATADLEDVMIDPQASGKIHLTP